VAQANFGEEKLEQKKNLNKRNRFISLAGATTVLPAARRRAV
jgi:hypothetical protein